MDDDEPLPTDSRSARWLTVAAVTGIVAIAVALLLRPALDDDSGVQVSGPLADRVGTSEWGPLGAADAPLPMTSEGVPAIAIDGDAWTIDYLSNDCDVSVGVVVREDSLAILPRLGPVCGDVGVAYRLRLTWRTPAPPSLDTGDVRIFPAH